LTRDADEALTQGAVPFMAIYNSERNVALIVA